MAAIDDILVGLKNGDHKAYETIFKSWYSPLCAYACSMLRDMIEAEEVVQKMFCTLWDKRAEMDVQISLKSYLYKAVHNSCLNRIKHGKVKEQYKVDYTHTHEEAHEYIHNSIISRELEEKLNQAVELLPMQCRKVFELSRVEYLTYPEIAERLQISRNTVENHMSKALRLLRESLKEFLIFLAFIFLTRM